jgi:hypothetical protein
MPCPLRTQKQFSAIYARDLKLIAINCSNLKNKVFHVRVHPN